MAASPPAVPTLSRTLRSRHVALISIGGIIGAGLFVGSSANIATVGPAVLVSYLVAGVLMFLVMRMLAAPTEAGHLLVSVASALVMAKFVFGAIALGVLAALFMASRRRV